LPHAAPTGAPRGSTSTPAAAAPDVDLLGGPDQALAANAAQADELVGEGAADLKTPMAALRGHPVVVNQWGSWCRAHDDQAELKRRIRKLRRELKPILTRHAAKGARYRHGQGFATNPAEELAGTGDLRRDRGRRAD
jgi:hypothetical protein